MPHFRAARAGPLQRSSAGCHRTFYPLAPDLGIPVADDYLLPDSTLLFRYSALTSNGHHVHYDYRYATEVEGYDDLLVHAPLPAILMQILAALVLGAGPLRFADRGVSPLTCIKPVRVEAHRAPYRSQAVRVLQDRGPVTMIGRAIA